MSRFVGRLKFSFDLGGGTAELLAGCAANMRRICLWSPTWAGMPFRMSQPKFPLISSRTLRPTRTSSASQFTASVSRSSHSEL